METIKKLKSISWDVPEKVYREDPALSYSILAKYEREGFNKLDTLFEHISTSSTVYGSAVDALITGGRKEFEDNFIVADFPEIKDSVKAIVTRLFKLYGNDVKSIDEIPNSNIIPLTEEMNFQNNWKPETRAKVIREQGFEYYKLLFIAKDKKILDNKTAQDVFAAVRALKESKATKNYFIEDNPFDNITREYQLKFKATIQGVDYRCMPDELITDHHEKIVYPIDLKTSSHVEWEFPESFIQWVYEIQARLYSQIIRMNMDKDDYFKYFKLANYRFIVVNRRTLTPLVWEFEDTFTQGELHYGKDIKLRDPLEIGRELNYYLEKRPKTPTGINTIGVNSIVNYLNKNA